MINRDRIVVVKANGTVLGETSATITDDLIVIKNVAPQLIEGDTIIHRTDGGSDVYYRIIEAIYYAGTGAHYQLRVERFEP
ncbi:MAG TPA: hypothetical protein VF042_00700 [Gemmatimonadaceae bacterium]